MRRIKDKMMLVILSTTSLLLIALTIIIAFYIFFTEQDNILNRNLLTARSYASQIEAFINKYNSITQTLAHSQKVLEAHSRKEVLNFLKQIANEDTSILGSWVIYEPNAFDNSDQNYANTIGHDKTGRFLPYWNRIKGNLVLEPVIDVETSDFYTVPRKTKEIFIPTPFVYEGVLMMSFCHPIIQNNIFKGVAGLDISIETVKKLLEGFDEKKIYKSNYAILVSNNGMIVSASNHLFNDLILNKKTLTQIAGEHKFPEYETIAKEILQKKEGFINTKDIFTKENIVTFYSPIKTGNMSLIVSISKTDLLASTLKAIYILTMIGIVCLIIIGIILYNLINTIIDPLNKLTDTVIQFGKQDFAQRSRIVTNDEFGELAKNFNYMANSIEEYSNEMEKKVNERTVELNQSLEEVTKLKFQQDGDYFLTSILLVPFYKKIAYTEKVKIDFLIEQKKTFEFKGKKLSIGGDLCSTEKIILNDKSYIVFINADAMGKSLQGAGGALILGSVFGNIISRNKTKVEFQNLSPEKWLKNTFIELHTTFETFDGSMLVSVTLGLLEEETGALFYINAEHPFTILYRDGCASFLETSVVLRKLGTQMLEGKIKINVFRMRKNDIILIGSDGKDDLVISHGEEGKRVINEDEKLILRVAEKSLGDIKLIKENLKNHGELMDDLSLLRIEYLGDNSIEDSFMEKTVVINRKEAIKFLEESEINNYFKFKRLTKLYIKEKDYEKAYFNIKILTESYPSETEILHIASFCAMKLNKISESIEFIERCLLREPMNERYLNLYSKLKVKRGNKIFR
ncbi:MAG: cache domain-containing protein [Leptospiraceae bacterium]|nr:cache domain-containing protein [Leptospiraceae bacterium]